MMSGILFQRLLYIIVRGSAVLMPLIILAGYAFGGLTTYIGAYLVFGFYFFVEFIMHKTKLGLGVDVHDEFQFLPWKHLLLIYGVLQIVAVIIILVTLPLRHLETYELIGIVVSLGIMTGSVGGLAAHEFIHRRTKWERILGLMLFGSVNYAHFYVSHLRGHHRNVGLHYDWSTARYGESSYQFLLRATICGWIGAWKFNRRFMIKCTAIQIGLWLLLYLCLGLQSLIAFWSMSFIAIVLMEMVNYLSHYGLTRTIDAKGRPEPVQNRHSWESNNKVTNWFIFNAGKHSHHHRSPFQSYETLALSHERDFLPHGLPLMTLIAFLPPLYFKIMDRLLGKSC